MEHSRPQSRNRGKTALIFRRRRMKWPEGHTFVTSTRVRGLGMTCSTGSRRKRNCSPSATEPGSMVFTTGLKANIMNAPRDKTSSPPEAPVFPQTLHRMRPDPAAVAREAAPSPKSKKRPNIFSKSRDTREDRGERQMKTSHNPQTFPHGK